MEEYPKTKGQGIKLLIDGLLLIALGAYMTGAIKAFIVISGILLIFLGALLVVLAIPQMLPPEPDDIYKKCIVTGCHNKKCARFAQDLENFR